MEVGCGADIGSQNYRRLSNDDSLTADNTRLFGDGCCKRTYSTEESTSDETSRRALEEIYI